MAINPNEFKSYTTKNMDGETVTFVSSFETADMNKEKPLEFDGRNRFVVTLIKKRGDVKVSFVKANIPFADLAEIIDNNSVVSTLRANSWMNKSTSVNEDAEEDALKSSPAFTVTLAFTPFRGKTPAEVLIENPDNETALQNMKNLLSKNLDGKYAANNKKQIEAIDSAINLLKIEELKSSTPARKGPLPFPIYEVEFKPFPKDLDKEGRNRCYQIGIYFDVTRKYPYEIRVTNYFAPVTTSATGLKNIDRKNAVNHTATSIFLSQSDWSNLLRDWKDQLLAFKIYRSPNVFNIFEDYKNYKKQFSYSNN